MSRLKAIVRNQQGLQPLRGGHSLCQGCGIPMVVRTVLSTIQRPAVVVNATGCLEVLKCWNRVGMKCGPSLNSSAKTGIPSQFS